MHQQTPAEICNPLLAESGLPAFDEIRADHVVAAVDQVLAQARSQVADLLHTPPPRGWDSFVARIEDINERISKVWSPIGHLHSVADTPELRTAHQRCLSMLSEYATDMGQNTEMYQGYLDILNSADFGQLTRPQRAVVEHAIREFRLSGVALDKPGKQRFKQLASELVEQSSRLGENVLDATQAWRKHITVAEELAGLPSSALELAGQMASDDDLAGWLFTLDYPSYLPVITYADNRALREEFYTAHCTRASDQGPDAGRWDNTSLIESILALRHEQAQLLGYPSYAHFSLVRKMAPDPAQVMRFLKDLAAQARPFAEAELSALQAFAQREHGINSLQAWDLPYYSEQLRQSRYEMSQESLRPYFPLAKVLNGLFAIVARLYSLNIQPQSGMRVWHPDVQFFDINDQHGELLGQFYLDVFARSDKRGGAWMDECRVRKCTANGIQLPVAYLTCNFTPPVAGKPALLTHGEVLTLFHEFGHGLHHLLTKVEYPSISGINGVAWDAVELPSQLMENWAWERDAMHLFAAHFETDEPFPDTLFERLKASRNFNAGLQMLRQLEFALFDFRLHLEYKPGQSTDIAGLLDDVRREIAVVLPPSFNRFAHGFTHIFGGGYAAGYYSYMWAEVLASDAFARFEERGIFDAGTGADFLHSVLESGGSRDAMELFVEFRGRPPQIDALLRHRGLSTASDPMMSAETG